MGLTLTLTRNELKEAVAGFNKIVNGRTTLPVLGCVRFDLNGRHATATVTDLDQLARYRFEAAKPSGDGAFILPLANLKDLTKGGGSEAVEFETADEETVFVTNHVGGHAVRHPLSGMDVEEWPAMDADVRTKPAAGFLETYRKLVPFASTDTTRYVLNSVFIDTAGKGDAPVTMAATDGRRLAAFNSLALPVKKPVVVPTTKFLAGARLTDPVEIGVRGNDKTDMQWFGVKAGPWEYTVKAVDGTYPNFRQVIPSEAGPNVVSVADEDVNVLKTVLPGFPGGEEVTVLGHEGKVTLYGRGSSDPTWTTLTLEHSRFKGARTFVGVNRFYLLEALDAGFREFAITDEFSPLLSRDGRGGLHVLMPMRVADPEGGAEAVPANAGADATKSAETAADTTEPDGPGEPVAPTASTQTPAPTPDYETKPTRRRDTNMTKDNGGTTTEPTALERVLSACEAAKTKVAEASTALTELARTIREAAREQKTQAKEVESARQALAKLQAISL